MVNIIVVFPKMEDAKGIRNLLVRHGFSVSGVCTTGTQALHHADLLHEGIVICGYHFQDMLYRELHRNLPEQFEMLLVASQRYWEGSKEEGMVYLPLPIKTNDLLNTVDMMAQALMRKKKKWKARPKERSREEKEVIEQAKQILIERNHLSEAEAHRYIQKASMDAGTNMVETAQMILQFAATKWLYFLGGCVHYMILSEPFFTASIKQKLSNGQILDKF